MSGHGAPTPRDESPEPSTSTTPTPALNFEFIDAQDRNTRSQIQRHTAYHAVQQRREAGRQRLLGDGSTPRFFEWQRRSNPDSTSPTTSLSRLITPSGSTTRGYRIFEDIEQENNMMSSPSVAPVATQYTDNEEGLLQYYTSMRCRRRSHETYFARILKRARNEPSAAYLIMAYAAAHRADSETLHRIQDIGLAADYKVKSLILVNNRLMTASGIDKASNQNIQAVLFLLAYETRFGTPQEAATHLNGLRGMIHERGGLRAFEEQAELCHQLLWVEVSGTAVTVLDCGPSCESTPAVPYAALNRISLNELSPRENMAESFIHKLRLFRSHEHLSSLQRAFMSLPWEYQIASVTLDQVVDHTPGPSYSILLNDCRLACLFYINALIFTSHNSDQKAVDVIYDTISQHFHVDFPTNESPTGLLWVFLYSLQLSNEDNRETLRIVIVMMQAARLLKPQTFQMVLDVFLQMLFYPHNMEPLIESDIARDILC